MKDFHLTLEKKLYDLLRLIAFQTNRSMNDIARKGIERYLEELLKKKTK